MTQKLEPSPQVNVFGWIWRKWFNQLWTFTQFETTQTTVTTTAANLGDNFCTLIDDDTAGGAVTVTLPPAANFNRHLHVKKLGTTGNVTIDGNGSETVDGSAGYTLTVQYQSVTVFSNGTGWFIL